METLLEKDGDQRSTRKIMEPPKDASAQQKCPVKDRKPKLKKGSPSQIKKRPSEIFNDKIER